MMRESSRAFHEGEIEDEQPTTAEVDRNELAVIEAEIQQLEDERDKKKISAEGKIRRGQAAFEKASTEQNARETSNEPKARDQLCESSGDAAQATQSTPAYLSSRSTGTASLSSLQLPENAASSSSASFHQQYHPDNSSSFLPYRQTQHIVPPSSSSSSLGSFSSSTLAFDLSVLTFNTSFSADTSFANSQSSFSGPSHSPIVLPPAVKIPPNNLN
ncbi:hypothetical protein JCM11251_007117 [Rhodosporidiobolus azoricus]